MSRSTVLRLLVWVIMLGMAAGFVVATSAKWIQVGRHLDAGIQPSGSPSKATGPFFLESDSYYWLDFARRIAGGETARVRFTHADNAPYGRDVHWSQSVAWLLAGMGEFRRAVAGGTLNDSLEQAAVWLNPALLVGFLVFVGGTLLFRIGVIPAGLVIWYLATQGSVGWAFHPLRPDHQTLHVIFGVTSLLGLVLGGGGWVRTSTENRSGLAWVRALDLPPSTVARWWFVLSGVAAGLGLWVSAAVEGIIIVMVMGAGVLMAWLTASLNEDGEARRWPELWRWWGWACAGTSLVFYLVEYFPAHLSLRLEVNGPLYALWALLVGEAIYQLLRAQDPRRRSARWFGLLCGIGGLALPFLIFLGPESVHAMRDGQMFRLHQAIAEFQPYLKPGPPGLMHRLWVDYGILTAFVAAGALMLVGSRRRGCREWPVYWLATSATGGLFLMALMQVRWAGLYEAMAVILAALIGAWMWEWFRPGTRPLIWAGVIVLILAFQPGRAAARQWAYGRDVMNGGAIPRDYLYPILYKKIAQRFGDVAGGSRRVLADPELAPQLAYFAGAQSVSSLYWENQSGLHALSAFLAAEDEGGARKVARERGLTNVLLLRGNKGGGYYSWLENGRPAAGRGNSVAEKLLRSEYALSGWVKSSAAMESAANEVYFYRGKSFEVQSAIYEIVEP